MNAIRPGTFRGYSAGRVDIVHKLPRRIRVPPVEIVLSAAPPRHLEHGTAETRQMEGRSHKPARMGLNPVEVNDRSPPGRIAPLVNVHARLITVRKPKNLPTRNAPSREARRPWNIPVCLRFSHTASYLRPFQIKPIQFHVRQLQAIQAWTQRFRPHFASAATRAFRAFRQVLSDPASGRVRRTTLLLAGIWILGIYDLLLTIHAAQTARFLEANPLARPLVGSPAALATLRIGALLSATLVFFIFRRHRLTEIGCWVVCSAYTVLAFIWFIYCFHLAG